MRLYRLLLEAKVEDTYQSVVDRFQRDFPDMMDKLIEFGSYMNKSIKLEDQLSDDDSLASNVSAETLNSLVSGIDDYLSIYDKTDFPALKQKVEDSINDSLESYTKMMKRHYDELVKLVAMRTNPPSKEEMDKEAERFLAKISNELEDIKRDVRSFGGSKMSSNQNYNQ